MISGTESIPRDFIMLLAIFTSILVAFFSFFALFLFNLLQKKTRKEVDDLEKGKQEIIDLRNEICEISMKTIEQYNFQSSSVRALNEISKSIDIRLMTLESAVTKYVLNNEFKIVKNILIKESEESRFSTERLYLELDLYSPSLEERVTSYHLLSEVFGNHDSLLKMKKQRPTGKEKDKLDRCLSVLHKRLENEHDLSPRNRKQ